MKKTLFCAAALAAMCLASGAQAAHQPKPATTTPPADTAAPANPDPASHSVNPATPATPATPAAPAAASATPAAPATPATPPSGSASTGASADTNATATAPLAVGMTVNDSTGAEIGKVIDLKPDASGQQMATVQMGTDKFAVAATSIGVQNGTGMINLTKADLQAKLHPGH